MSSYGLTWMWLVNPARRAAGTATTDLPARPERLPLDQRQQDYLSTPHAASLPAPSGQ